MKVIIAVGDGSQMIWTSRAWFESAAEAELFIRQQYKAHGPRYFWLRCRRQITLDRLMHLVSHHHLTGYLLDDHQWSRCALGDDGEMRWSEVDMREKR